MKNIDLPEQTAKIYKKIKQKYKVEFESVRLRGKELQLLQVADLEPLLGGRDPFKNVSDFPFWVKLWEAALILADTIAGIPPRPGQTLLELGAGLGAPGLVAAAAGYKVTLSDYDALILDFQRVSAAANGLNDIDFKIIDWKRPPELPLFDTIIGAEILFREEFFDPLLKVFKHLLSPQGTIYLAHDIRRKSLSPFLRKAEKDYEIAFSTRKMTSDEDKLTIVVNRLRPRKTSQR